MLLKSALLGVLLATGFAASSWAQSTATPVVTGYISTSGCPYGQTSCFVQYGTLGPPSSVTVVAAQVTGGKVGVTVGTSSAQALAAETRSYSMVWQNVSVTQIIFCTDDGTAAVVNGAGSWEMFPGGSITFGPTSIPQGQVNCIASAAGGALTIERH